jgi:hypothetical protein
VQTRCHGEAIRTHILTVPEVMEKVSEKDTSRKKSRRGKEKAIDPMAEFFSL